MSNNVLPLSDVHSDPASHLGVLLLELQLPPFMGNSLHQENLHEETHPPQEITLFQVSGRGLERLTNFESRRAAGEIFLFL